MLPVPTAIENDPALEPVLSLLRSTLLTADELADHWRYSTQHLANQRRARRGCPFIKLSQGAIRYRLSDVIRAELHGSHGYTPQRLAVALLTIPGIDHDLRKRIEEHVRRVLAEPVPDDLRAGAA